MLKLKSVNVVPKTFNESECVYLDMSSEEEEVTEVESFMLDQEIERAESSSKPSTFLLPTNAIDETDLRSVDPETHARLEALLDAAGIGKLSTPDGKALTDPEVLRKLTSSVSCALDEAAAALTRMRAEQQAQIGGSGDGGRSLVEACTDGDVKTVRKMLIEGGSVHETTEEGESLLSLACSAGYYELAQVLLAMKANVEDRGIKGDCTPLMEAASGGYLDIVKLLILHQADVKAQSSAGNTPLHYAAAGGFVEIVETLLEAHANVEEHNENGHTPLMEAASAGHVPVAKALLDAGAGINTHSNEFKESALTLACYKGHLEMVKFLLEAGADQEHKTDEMHTALMEASMDGHVNVARLLLDSGAQVNMPPDSFESPLTLAACGGHADLASLLIERGANLEEVNDEGYTPLMEAAREGHEEMVAILLAHGAEINAQTEETQETALTLACCGGFLEVAEFLIKVGADVELGCSTPLMEASQEGHLELVRFLIKAGASVHAQTATGDTALTYACENGHTEVADVLIAAGAHIDHESEGGRTPLMKAARAGHFATVNYLIAKGCDINKQTTTNDHTVLSLACAGGHLTVVDLLLSHGANALHKLKDGSTMVIEASKGGHHQVVNLLLNWPSRLLTPEMAQIATADFNEHRVPFPGLANYVPPSDPDSVSAGNNVTLPAVIPQNVNFTPKQNPHNRKEKVKFPSGNGAACTQPIMNMNIPASKPIPIVPSSADVASMDAVSANDKPAVKASPPQAPTAVPAPVTDPAYGAIDDLPALMTDDIADFRASERLDAIFSSMVKDLILNMSGSPEEQMLQRQQVLEELQKVERELREKAQSHLAVNSQQAKKARSDSLDPAQLQALELQLQQLNLQQQLDQLKDGTIPPSAVSQLHRVLQKQLEFARVNRAATSANPDKPGDATCELDVMDVHDLEMIIRAQMREAGFNVSLDVVPSLTNDDDDDGGGDEFIGDTLLDTDNLLDQNYAIPIDNVADPNLTISTDDVNMNLLSEITNNFGSLTLPVEPPAHHAFVTATSQGHDPRNVPPTSLDNMGYVMDPGIQPMASPKVQAVASPSMVNPTQYTPSIVDILSKQSMLSNMQQAQPGQAGQNFTTPQVAQAPVLTQQQKEQLLQQLQQQQLAQALLSQTNQQQPQSQPHLQHQQQPQQQPFVQFLQQWKQQQQQQQQQPDADVDARQFIDQSQRNGGGLDIETITPPSSTPLTPNPSPASPQNWLYSGVDIDAQTESNHDTALTLACAGGHAELVSLLLSKQSDIEHRDKKGFTPLILAATAGHVEVVEILLDHGADIEAQSERTKDTPLSLACSGGRFEVVELLLARGANKEHRNVSDYTPLSLAASGGYVNIIKHQLSHGAEINSRTGSKLGISPLMLAAMNGHTAAVKLLLDMGSDINAQIETNRNTALTLACFQGRHEVVSLLVDRKANIEHRAKTGLTPLMEAASGGYVDVGRVLLDKGADVNAPPVPSSRDTALTIAADKGHYKFVELLLNRNAAVDVKNKKGDSPLWLACNGGHLDVAQLLAAHGDIDSQDNRKVSCLMAAFRKGHTKVVKWMVKHVCQFPSDQECSRYIQTITDKELQKKCQLCMDIIESAKAQQAAEANKNATILLEELDMEKKSEELKKAAQERRRQKRKKKRKEKQEKGKEKDDVTKNSSPEPDEEIEKEEKKPEKAPPEPVVNIGPPSATTMSTMGTSLVTYTSVDARNKRNRGGGTAANKTTIMPHDLITTAIHTSVLTTITNSLPRATTAKISSALVTATTTTAAAAAPEKSATIGRNRKEKPRERPQSARTATTTKTLRYPARQGDANQNNAPSNQHGAHGTRHRAPESSAVTSASARKKKDADARSSKITAIGDLDDFGTISECGKLSDREFVKITKAPVGKRSYNSLHGSSHGHRGDHSGMTNGPAQPHNAMAFKSPHSGPKRQNQRKEDGWKEVVRKCKKVTVPSTAISRVIGRGGCNINAIRDASTAHIEVEKQRGTSDRLITIRGSVEATRQAHILIMSLVNEPDKDLCDLMPEALALSAPPPLMNDSAHMSSSSINSLLNPAFSKSAVATKSSTVKALQFTSSAPVTNPAPTHRVEKFTAPPILVWNNAQAQQSSVTIAASPKKVLMKAAAAQSLAGTGHGPQRPLSGGAIDRKTDHQTNLSTSTVVTFTSGGHIRSSPPVGGGSGADRSSSKVPQRSVSAPIRVLPRPASVVSKPDQQPLPVATAHNASAPASIIPNNPQFSPFNNLFSDVHGQVIGKKEENRMNFASVVAAGVASSSAVLSQQLPNRGDLSTVILPNDTSSLSLESDLSHQAKAPGFKPARMYTTSPYSFPEPSGKEDASPMYRNIPSLTPQRMSPPLLQNSARAAPHVAPQISQISQISPQVSPQLASQLSSQIPSMVQPNMSPQSQILSQLPLLSQQLANSQDCNPRNAPRYRSNVYAHNSAGISPRNSGSMSGGASPRNQSADPLQLAMLLSGQKEEYSTPNRPMTLPKIGSGLNPNAPDFTIRMHNIVDGQPSATPPPPPQPSDHGYHDNQLFGGVGAAPSLAMQQLYQQQQQQAHMNQQMPNAAAMVELQQQQNIYTHFASMLQQKLQMQTANAATGGVMPQLYQHMQHPQQQPSPVLNNPALMAANMPDADLMQALNNGIRAATPPDNFSPVLDDRKTLQQPIGSGRAQRKPGHASAPNMPFWPITTDMNEWSINSPISTMAHVATTVIMTSVMVTSTVMTPSVTSRMNDHQQSLTANSAMSAGFGDVGGIDQQFQNQVLLMPHMFNSSTAAYSNEMNMYEPAGPDVSVWNNPMKTPGSDPDKLMWNNWSQQGNM